MADTPKHYKLDRDLIFKLATLHCTYKEIASVVGTSETTLEKRYSGIIEKGRAEGKKSLRRAQMEKALAGDVRMLIWMGKQYLDQKDSPQDEENTVPLPWDEAKE
jgi:hypothetical protein|tara:strand:+ start:1807 stop:2121 length:315 start_codon:yes stop_codon:yes gene_type:complete